MKDFSDFIEYLSESIASERLAMPELSNIYMLTDTSPESIAAFMQNYADNIVRVSSMISIQYLHAYHKWLQSQNE